MVLISIVLFAIVLGPACIGILLATLVLVSVFRNLSFLDLLILLPGVPLDGNLQEGGIHHLPGVQDDPVFAQLSVNKFEKNLNQACLGQPIAKQPNRLGIQDPLMNDQTKKMQKTRQSRIAYSVLSSLIL
jgi:hypothetical protein